MKFTKTAFIVLALLLLSCSGCSRVQFGYNHADWLLRYWINGYTSFNAGQKQEIRNDVAIYMRWHRKDALPEYTAFLQNLDALIDGDRAMNADDVMHVRSDMSSLYRLTMTPAIRPAAHVLSTLDKGQIEALRNTLIKQDREEREESLFGNRHDDLDTRAKKYLHFVEDLVGDLNHDQEEKIRQMSLHIPFVTTSYIEQREARQAALIAMLHEHATEDKITAFLAQWINMPVVPMSPQAQQAFEAYDSAMNDMIARISGLLTAAQKNHLRKKISGYIGDLQQLHSATQAQGGFAHPPRSSGSDSNVWAVSQFLDIYRHSRHDIDERPFISGS